MCLLVLHECCVCVCVSLSLGTFKSICVFEHPVSQHDNPRPVVVACKVGGRSGQLCGWLDQAGGFNEVRSFVNQGVMHSIRTNALATSATLGVRAL